MKKLILCGLLVIVLGLALITEKGFCRRNLELDARLFDCAEALTSMLDAPDGGIPADLLQRSKGIVIFPDVLKAGLGVGGHYGKGVVMRRDSASGKWGPPVFIRLIGGSFGWQVGVQATDLVLLIMNDVSLKSLFKDKITIGADASVAAGPLGRDASAGAEMDLSVGMLSYSRARGLFLGVSIKGSVIEVDWDANEKYYRSDLSIIDIFFKGKGVVSPEGQKLVGLLNSRSQKKPATRKQRGTDAIGE